MSFERPKLKAIIDRLDADIQSRLTVPQLRHSNAKVYGRVLAGAAHGLYGFVEYISKHCFFDTAENKYLDRWASIFGVTRKPALKARGSVKISFSSEQVLIPVGTVLQSTDSVRYVTTSAVGSDGVADVEALAPGDSGNQEKDDVLMFASPIVGVYNEATIVGLSGGSDAEDDDSLRSRLLSRVRDVPHGGTKSDYVQWAREVPGVTRAWCYPEEDGEGTVTVRFVCDGMENIIPDEAMLQKVKDYLDTLRPVTAHLTVSAPIIEPVAIKISGLLPETDAVKESVKRELTDLFAREAVPGGRVYLSHIRAAISAAVGEEDHTLVSPTSDPLPDSANGLLALGAITWE